MANRIEVFEQMMAGDPENTMVLFGLANEYLKNGDTEQGIETLGIYLEKADDEGAAYGMLSKALEDMGKIEEAKDALRKGIETALSHGHPTMADEFQESLEQL
ncbi:MAG: tetratricopeptide repeat protein [Acidobacteriota bacterium]|nr:tetratricopeptide repeat protein [Acidobacteriota bacterium]MDH3530330.1 tetratricopeptide repeat protein [Acidobacteriota bacterium]